MTTHEAWQAYDNRVGRAYEEMMEASKTAPRCWLLDGTEVMPAELVLAYQGKTRRAAAILDDDLTACV